MVLFAFYIVSFVAETFFMDVLQVLAVLAYGFVPVIAPILLCYTILRVNGESGKNQILFAISIALLLSVGMMIYLFTSGPIQLASYQIAFVGALFVFSVIELLFDRLLLSSDFNLVKTRTIVKGKEKKKVEEEALTEEGEQKGKAKQEKQPEEKKQPEQQEKKQEKKQEEEKEKEEREEKEEGE